MDQIGGKGVLSVMRKNEIFSRATWLCHRLRQAMNCVSTESRLNHNESCPTIFELGHCWKETPHGDNLYTNCPRLNPLPSDIDGSLNTTRRCLTADRRNDSVVPAGWLGIYDLYHSSLKDDCNYEYTEDYGDYGYAYEDSASYGSSGSVSNYSVEPMLNMSLVSSGIELPTLTWYLNSLMILSILSFITTLTSLLLMFFFLRKCTRIYIHMNLLAAFMFRSLVFIWSQMIFIWQEPSGVEEDHKYITNLTSDLSHYESFKFDASNLPEMNEHYDGYCVSHLENEKKFLLLCRLYPSLQHYCVLAEFAWLTCEGIYLILLQQRPTVLFEKINPLRWFVAISWLLPAGIVFVWMMVMLNRPNGEFTCFSNDKFIVWIVEAPIQLFILICFFIFIVLLQDIIQKLRAPDYIGGKGNFPLRMSKATLSLIPLLGIQYSLLPYLSKDYGVSQSVENVSTTVTIIITASHGIVVSFLYCFTSSEMKQALIRRWRLHRELTEIYNEISSRRPSRSSFSGGRRLSRYFDRFTPRNSLIPTRQVSSEEDPSSNNVLLYNSRKESVFKFTPKAQRCEQSISDDNRLSSMSKQSNVSSDSYGYGSFGSLPEEAPDSGKREETTLQSL